MTTETSRPGCVIDDERGRMIDELIDLNLLPVYDLDVSGLVAVPPVNKDGIKGRLVVMVRTKLPDGTIIDEPMADAAARQKAQRADAAHADCKYPCPHEVTREMIDAGLNAYGSEGGYVGEFIIADEMMTAIFRAMYCARLRGQKAQRDTR